jgi:hypothetical protein
VNEKLQAEALAVWLADEPGRPAPAEVDAEVLETIFALRPEYAPPHGVTIEHILSSLTDGPLLDPAVAEALQEWLASPAGTPPPPVLPVGVVEATYVLRPELAPALRVGIDDILGELREGPLAEPQVIDLDAERVKQRWWATPTVAVAAVAATVLFFVGPLSNKADEAAIVGDYIGKSASAVAEAPSLQAIDFKAESPADNNKTLSETSAAPASRSAQRAAVPPPQSVTVSAPPPPPAAVAATTLIESTEQMAFTPPPAMEETLEAMEPPPAPIPDRSAAAGGGRAESIAKRSRPARHRRDSELDEYAEAEPQISADEDAQAEVQSLRLDPRIGVLERQSETDMAAGKLEDALRSLELALVLPTLTRFDTARLWRRKAVVLAEMGRETDAKHARETAAKLDPTR